MVGMDKTDGRLNKRALLSWFLIIILASVSFAQSQSVPQMLVDQMFFVLQLVAPIFLAALMIAVVAYAASPLFGPQIAARGKMYAHGILSSIAIVAGVLIVLYVIFPGLSTGTLSLSQLSPSNLSGMINSLINSARSALAGLILLSIALAGVLYAGGTLFGVQARARAHVWANNLIAGSIVGSILYVIFFQVLLPSAAPIIQNTILSSYANMLILLITVIALFAIIVYLLSKFLQVPEWEAYLRVEMSNIINSIFILMFVLGMFSVADTLSTSMFGTSQGGQINSVPIAAADYLQKGVFRSVVNALYDTYVIQMCSSAMSVVYKRPADPAYTPIFKIFPGVDMFVSITNVLTWAYLALAGTLEIQITILYLIAVLTKLMLLPAGLILRFIPPTREAGHFLVALSFAFYIIFPVSYMINKTALTEIGAKDYKSPAGLVSSFCGFKYIGASIVGGLANMVLNAIPGASALAPVVNVATHEAFLHLLNMNMFLGIIKYVAQVSLIALFAPSLGMTLSIGFINAFTKFLNMKID